MSVRVAVIYYSATGDLHALAAARAEGAEGRGAEIRLRRVHELAPEAAIDSNPTWRAHVDATKDSVQEARTPTASTGPQAAPRARTRLPSKQRATRAAA